MTTPRGPRSKTIEWVLAVSTRTGNCHVWPRKVTRHGYPSMQHEGKEVLVAPWIYRQSYGLGIDKLHLTRTCGNLRCVNPKHLIVLRETACSITECSERANTKGMCKVHYMRVRTHGSPALRSRPAERVDIRTRLGTRTTVSGTCHVFKSGSVMRGGYCRIWYQRKHQPAHRVAYQINVGPIPDGMVIRHKCDNPPCINPDHLLLGTQKDNMRDRFERGRDNTARGSRSGVARLTEWQVAEIKTWLRCGRTQTQLAARYGVSQATISRIKRNQGWKHVLPADIEALTPWATGPAHPPPSAASLRAVNIFAVPARRVLEEVA